MKNKLRKLILTGCLTASIFFTGCSSGIGNDPVYVDFRNKVDSFCTSISDIDANINSIDTSSPEYITVLMTDLDALNLEFSNFASLDFPTDYDYLEPLADEAAEYMNTAVTTYHEAFEKNYTEEAMDSKFNYATENYNRAYKRIQVIITFLNGDVSEDVTIQN